MKKIMSKEINIVILIILILTLIIIPVNAVTYDEDITFSEGNIDYVFKQGVEIDSFDISPGGIKINGNEEKIGITIQGGKLSVNFYDMSENKKIGFKSSVPQLIDFKITSGGVEQYLDDGEKYYLNSYRIGTEEINFTYYEKQSPINSIINKVKLSDDITKLEWWQQKLVVFETSSSIDDSGIIKGETFAISYIAFTIIMLLIILFIVLWRSL